MSAPFLTKELVNKAKSLSPYPVLALQIGCYGNSHLKFFATTAATGTRYLDGFDLKSGDIIEAGGAQTAALTTNQGLGLINLSVETQQYNQQFYFDASLGQFDEAKFDVKPPNA